MATTRQLTQGAVSIIRNKRQMSPKRKRAASFLPAVAKPKSAQIASREKAPVPYHQSETPKTVKSR